MKSPVKAPVGWLRGWRLPVRLARRDAQRARGRSVLVLVMIALPVLGVTAADVVLATQDVDSVEGLDRRLGSAAASVTAQKATDVLQAPDPDDFSTWNGETDRLAPTEKVAETLGGARLVPWREGYVRVATEKGRTEADVLEIDLTDPVAEGLVRLTDGRLPAAADEVVVNAELAAKGYAVGDRLDLTDDQRTDPVVVGVAESAEVRSRPFTAGPVGALGLEHSEWTGNTRSWLVAGGDVTWREVRALNALGATVVSRAVITDPPPLPPEVEEWVSTANSDEVAVVLLVVVMALLEVVLLAGPAFAVGARRQSRSLALMAATGGTPRQARRVVLAGALVLGGVASVLGVVLGIGVGRLAVPVLQGFSASWFGPFDVPWLHLLGIAAFGLVSAVLAALVPAWIASRQDVVAVLAGRRGDRKPSLRSPALGVVLLGGGVALAAYGAVGTGDSAVLIAASAVVAVLGMVLLVPVVLVGVARASRWLPLVLRYAVRDAARHRTRTVPAVAAVAATVAGVVALGIALQSDEAQNRATYVPQLAEGASVLSVYDEDLMWNRVEAVVARELPDVEVVEVSGAAVRGGFVDVSIRTQGGEHLIESSWGSVFGSDLLVGPDVVPLLAGVEDRDAVERALADGAMVAFSNTGLEGRHDLRLRVRSRTDSGKPRGPALKEVVSAVVVPVDSDYSGPRAVLDGATAQRLGIPTETVALAVPASQRVDADQEGDVAEALAAISDEAFFYVERGYQADDSTAIIQGVLAGLGAVLMLGGTLTATFLALSDARPDLATLAAVGAAPRTRRGVAAAYALVVGLVGAALGAAVGFVPGVAVTYPLTSEDWSGGEGSHYLDVPWLMIGGLVVVLPLLTALVVGLAARSRLPLVARLD